MDLDLLVAGRTAPNHSWKNPVERFMSIINLGLQCVGIMRREGGAQFEQAIKNVNNVNAICEAVGDRYIDEVTSSVAPTVQLLNSITTRLELKGKPLSLFERADPNEMEAFWEILQQVDSSLERSDTSKSVLCSKPKLKEFFEHCCQTCHYSFCVKKCGSSD